MSESANADAEGQGQGQGAEGQAPVAAPAAPRTSVPEVLPKWAEDRLAEMRRRLGDEERARALAEARLKDLSAKPEGQATPPASAPTPEAEIQNRAMELASRMQFNEACNNIARQGAAKFDDFASVVGNFGKYLGDIPPSFVEAALETEDPAGTIYALGQNMAEATRIAGLSPARQAAAVVKFAAKLEKDAGKAAAVVAPAGGSAPRAPSPIVPRVGSNAGPRNTPVRLDDDNTDIGEWMKARKESLKRA